MHAGTGLPSIMFSFHSWMLNSDGVPAPNTKSISLLWAPDQIGFVPPLSMAKVRCDCHCSAAVGFPRLATAYGSWAPKVWVFCRFLAQCTSSRSVGLRACCCRGGEE